MGAQHFGKYISDLLKQQAATLRERIGGGSCSNFEAYKSETGRAKGLEDAANTVEQEMRKYQQGDNDA